MVWCFALALTLAASGPTYRGMSYTPWGEAAVTSPQSERSIKSMKAAGIDSVALNVWWFQDEERSTTIAEDRTRHGVSLASARKAIRQMHRLGFKVMLKPNVDLRNGRWRAGIVPSPAWFDSYRGFILAWARLAQSEKVELFCVGCELSLTEADEAQWRQTIAEVRKVYKGKLTYAANFGRETEIKWWNALDFIGIDAYYRLSDRKDPTAQELSMAWVAQRNRIKAWLNGSRLKEKVIFTEIGYQSAYGCANAPWNVGPGAKVDLRQQADCIRAMLEAMWGEVWWEGLFFWTWEANPDAGGPADAGFTPQGKPALKIIERFYKCR